MKVISALGRVKFPFKNAVLAIGVFDGVHLGHQALIRQMLRRARALGVPGVVMTFSPHPAHVLYPERQLPYLSSLPQRLDLIENLGVDVCVVIKFTKEFSRQTPAQFIEKYLIKNIHPKEIFVGENFKFGQNRSGDLDFFRQEGKRFGFKVNIVRSVQREQQVVSSSRIRKLISDGRLDLAAELLGRPVSLMGKVIKGEARGRKIGYPTANVDYHGKIVPPEGVYAVDVVLHGKKFPGMANVGHRPSFHENGLKSVEVHILDFDKNLYGRKILLEFLQKIRDEKKFSSPDALVQQLITDEKVTRKLLSKKFRKI